MQEVWVEVLADNPSSLLFWLSFYTMIFCPHACLHTNLTITDALLHKTFLSEDRMFLAPVISSLLLTPLVVPLSQQVWDFCAS